MENVFYSLNVKYTHHQNINCTLNNTKIGHTCNRGHIQKGTFSHFFMNERQLGNTLLQYPSQKWNFVSKWCIDWPLCSARINSINTIIFYGKRICEQEWYEYFHPQIIDGGSTNYKLQWICSTKSRKKQNQRKQIGSYFKYYTLLETKYF